MDNFTTVYVILRTLERAMDGNLDHEKLSAESLGVSEARRRNLLIAMQDEGLIKGVWHGNSAGGMSIRIDNIEITFHGLEYLTTSELMKKVRDGQA